VNEAMHTRGALLFVGDGQGVGRDAITHVAWSLGDGTTIEARGKAWGVGCWPSANRFDFAALVPGVDYTKEEDMPLSDEDLDKIKFIVAAELGKANATLYERLRVKTTSLRDSLSSLIRKTHDES
jgi:cell wall-associated NlpC family hydrolase